LTANTQCTAKDLSAIMADHYDAMESDFQVLQEKPVVRSWDIDSETVQERKKTPTNYSYVHRGLYAVVALLLN